MNFFDELNTQLSSVQKNKIVGKIETYELKRFLKLFDHLNQELLIKICFLPDKVRKVTEGHYDSSYTLIEYDIEKGFFIRRVERGYGYDAHGCIVEYSFVFEKWPIILNLTSKFISDWEKSVKKLKINATTNIMELSLFIPYEKFPTLDDSKLTDLEKLRKKLGKIDV